MYDMFMDQNLRELIGNNASETAQRSLAVGYQIDHFFMMKEASLGFLTENKESPYPWMLAACAVAGALPLCLTFFGVAWLECSRVIHQGLAVCGGG